MSKPVSYFDWELCFRINTRLRNKSEFNRDTKHVKIKVNSLGIIDEHFKEFLKKWKMKNL